MRFAYADPPYIGLAHLYPEKTEVDHAELIKRLGEYEGWALSLHTPSLRVILSLCPPAARVGAWVKPFCSFKPGVGVAYAWEPVIFCGGRKRTRTQRTTRDWVSANSLIKRGLAGAKPDDVCFFVFDVLNAEPGDEFADLYPGTGRVSRAWTKWLAYKDRAPASLASRERDPGEATP